MTHHATTLHAHAARRDAKADQERYPRKRHAPTITDPLTVDLCHYCEGVTDAPAYYLRFTDGRRVPVCLDCETYIENSVLPA